MAATATLSSKFQISIPKAVREEKWLVREAGEDEADQVIAYTQKCVVVPPDTAIALLAADLHREYKLATADGTSMRRRGTRGRSC